VREPLKRGKEISADLIGWWVGKDKIGIGGNTLRWEVRQYIEAGRRLGQLKEYIILTLAGALC
jgi:hypothetical protein